MRATSSPYDEEEERGEMGGLTENTISDDASDEDNVVTLGRRSPSYWKGTGTFLRRRDDVDCLELNSTGDGLIPGGISGTGGTTAAHSKLTSPWGEYLSFKTPELNLRTSFHSLLLDPGESRDKSWLPSRLEYGHWAAAAPPLSPTLTMSN